MRIVVTGSLAYDYIMDFPGYFADHILPEKVHMLTVSFLVDSMRRMRGGVAGNVAYTLALLGVTPEVCACAGQDFADYRALMERHGINTAGIRQIDGEFTSSCFINTDRSNNQIVAFYAGAMAHDRHLSLHGMGLTPHDFVVISPTDPAAITRFAEECRQLGVPFLFDPGKQTPRLSAEQIIAGIEGATALIGNDYEFAMMAQKTGRSEAELIASAPLTIMTRGEQGSTIFINQRDIEGDAQQQIEIPIAPVREVVDPTGAGDAYLAGLVYGLCAGLPIEMTGRVAALAAAYTIEHRGCQEHLFTTEAFAQRYYEVFGSVLERDAIAR